MRRILTYAICSGFVFLSGGVAQAQDTPHEAPPPPPMVMTYAGPGEPAGPFAVELLGFEGPVGGKKVVTGAPFSAVAVTETLRVLADGNRITRKTEANLYRDSQGRVRREVRLTGIGPLQAADQQHSVIVIHDPVAGLTYMLNQEKKVANKVSFHGGMPGPAQEKLVVHGQMAEDWQKEALGTQVINGVKAEGTRRTQTIPAGEIGNEKPIVIVSEQWYSPELQVMVMSKRNDPMSGETTYTLTSIQRQEPDASLFTAPSDYTMKEGGPGPGIMQRKVRQERVPPSPNN